MSELSKRLEIIKNAVALGDEDIIVLQAKRLPDSAAELAALLTNKEYAAATVWIDDFHKQNLPAVYQDMELEAMRLELNSLEKQLTDYDSEKSEMQRQIGEFNSAYMENCGEDLEKLLQEKLKQQTEYAEKHSDKNAQEEMEKTKRHYEKFRQQKEEPPVKHLDEDQQKELKTLYKKAAQKCHPDKLSPEQKAQGEEIFKQLQKAHAKNDLEQVREIWQSLQSGNWNAGSATISDKEELRRRIKSLRTKIAAIQAEIEAVGEDETYQTVAELAKNNTKWDEYFAKTKTQLQTELAKVQTQK